MQVFKKRNEGETMPQETHTVEIPLNINKVWEFTKEKDNWAPLIPGYLAHENENENQWTWVFKGDLGFMTKTIKLQINMKEWIEPKEVTFDLKGLSDNFKGGGFLLAESVDENTTKLSGHLDITGGGMMGAMVNQVLTKFVPDTTIAFTEAVEKKILEVN